MLNEPKLKNLITQFIASAEQNFLGFDQTGLVEMNGEPTYILGLKIPHDCLKDFKKGVMKFEIQLGMDDPDPNEVDEFGRPKITEKGTMEYTCKVQEVINISRAKHSQVPSMVLLNIVQILMKLTAWSQVNAIKHRYLVQNPSVF